MKKTLIIGFLVFCNSVFGQIPGKSIEGPIVLFDTLTVKKGDIIYLGKGSDPETGEFIHLYSPKDKLVNTLYTIFSNNDDTNYKLIPQRNLDKEFAGKQLVVNSFSQIKSKKNGNKILGVIDMYSGNSFKVSFAEETSTSSTFPVEIRSTIVIVEFEPAIRSGEIIKISAPELTEKAPAVELLFSPFEMTIKGIEPVVVAINNLSRNELYNKAINWTNSYYAPPNQATITTFSEDNISIYGLANKVQFASILGNDFSGDLPYLFSIDFTDGEIRMTFTLGGENGDITDENGAGINISPSSMFNKNGKVHKMSKDFKTEAEKIMNETASSLVDYLMK